MTKKLYIITGAPDSRKSSVIRALTGVRDTKTFNIQYLEGDEKTHVMVVSCNEIGSKKYPNGLTPTQLIDYICNLKKDEKAIIFPIRSIKPNFNLPLASEYIKVLVGAGFQIMPVVMFNEAVVLPNGIQGEVLKLTEEIPSNLTATKLRKIWGIV